MNRLDNSTIAVSMMPVLGLLSQAGASLKAAAPVVHIGGDIPGLEAAIEKSGWRVNKLESLDNLLEEEGSLQASCLILDVSWSALQNRALQENLSGFGAALPFICLVEEVNLATAVGLMKLGARDVFERSNAAESLIGAIRLALESSEAALKSVQEKRQVKRRFDLLTPRERQILTLIASGLLNKQVAGELGISEITVKAHRGSLMRKMEARSFAGLVKMAMVLAL